MIKKNRNHVVKGVIGSRKKLIVESESGVIVKDGTLNTVSCVYFDIRIFSVNGFVVYMAAAYQILLKKCYRQAFKKRSCIRQSVLEGVKKKAPS